MRLKKVLLTFRSRPRIELEIEYERLKFRKAKGSSSKDKEAMGNNKEMALYPTNCVPPNITLEV